MSDHSQSDQSGERIGHYHILRRLGRGGMGIVYAAKDTRTGQVVALKLPTFVKNSDETSVKRFYREARLAAAIEHENVCRVIEAEEVEGHYVLAMELIDGKTLSEKFELGEQFPIEQSLRWVVQLLQGLQAAHDQGVIHRDLKPSNVIIRVDDHPMILDFGMARKFDGEESLLTPSGAVVGTPGYMAPEQITGSASEIGPPTDIYGMGVILYELLSGWPPFTGDLATLLGSVVSDPPTPLISHIPELDPALQEICFRALEKDPQNRYASATIFASVIEAYLQGNQAHPDASQVFPQETKKGLFQRVFQRLFGKNEQSSTFDGEKPRSKPI